jgi:pimeloyl-ACP methyl ester carboxylesterase
MDPEGKERRGFQEVEMPLLTLSSGATLSFHDDNPQGTPAVLLLHGLGATGDSWKEHSAWLADAGWRVLAPDMRGFGESGYPGHTSIPALAQDMAELVQQVGAAPVHVVGLSLGGTVAQQLALEHPDLVRSLVLVNTFARLHPEGPRAWVYFGLRLLLVHTLGLGAQARLVARHMFPRPDQEPQRRDLVAQVVRANPRAYRATMRALWHFNVEERLGEIRVPTLVVTGGQDSTVSPRNQRVLVDSIPGARLAAVASANHAVPEERPAEFRRILEEFLQGMRGAETAGGPAGLPAR